MSKSNSVPDGNDAHSLKHFGRETVNETVFAAFAGASTAGSMMPSSLVTAIGVPLAAALTYAPWALCEPGSSAPPPGTRAAFGMSQRYCRPPTSIHPAASPVSPVVARRCGRHQVRVTVAAPAGTCSLFAVSGVIPRCDTPLPS
jgi:hypothetical protein